MTQVMTGPGLTGKRALVTGGTKGIGAATALALESAGADVVVAARQAPDRPVGGTHFLAADLSQRGQATELAERVLDRWGGLDVLVDNAGAQIVHERVDDFSLDEWWEDLQVNLLAAVELDRALLPALTESSGAIVHVSSTVARMHEPAVVAYAAAKAGLAAYSKALSRQVGAVGVRVNAVLPGFTATQMFVDRFEASAAEQEREYDELVADLMAQSGVPLGRPADPAEVAAVIAFLASPQSSYLTGTQTMVEGGIFPGLF